MSTQPRLLTPALTASIVVHALVLLTLLLVFRASGGDREPTPVTPPRAIQMVWIPDPRPAARGGGGQPQPKTPAPSVTQPVEASPPKPVVVEPQTAIAPEPEPQIVAEATPVVPAATPSDGVPQGASTGDGNKPGSGLGGDFGPGSGGDAVYGVGNGVTAPVPVRRPPPTYTAEAMRARLQGVVVLNCVVQKDGTCADIRVMRSLDMTFGLDERAIASAREWRFRPGTRLGEPVPVRVTLEIGFTIR